MSNYSAEVQLAVSLRQSKALGIGRGAATGAPSFSRAVDLPYGTAAGEVNLTHASAHTVAAEATLTHTLSSGLTDDLGRAVAFGAVRLLVIRNTGTVPLVVAGDLLGLSVDTLPALAAGGECVRLDPLAGITVTPSTADKITIHNPSLDTAGACEILLAGLAAS